MKINEFAKLLNPSDRFNVRVFGDAREIAHEVRREELKTMCGVVKYIRAINETTIELVLRDR